MCHREVAYDLKALTASTTTTTTASTRRFQAYITFALSDFPKF